MRYSDFEDTATNLFGLRGDELAELAEQMDAVGLPLEAVDVDDDLFWEVASDALEEYYESLEMYDLDPRFPGDEYLDAGIEWEMTAESEEGYGD